MNNINIKVAKLVLAVFTLTSFLSCKKGFFDTPDHGGIDAEIWNNEGAIEFSLNKTYDMIMPEFPYENTQFNMFFASDEDKYSGTENNMKKALGVAGNLAVNDVKFIGSKYQGTNRGDNKYFDIARCNNAILNIPLGSVAPEAKRKLKGQFHALRAIAYFDLVRIYGGVPLVLSPQDPNNITLEGRKSANECFKAIVNDLDSAAKLLDGVVFAEPEKLTKIAALALKARVLLYAASPQFNPVNDPIHPYDSNKWQIAFNASKEAYEACLAAGRSLIPVYGEIFQKQGAANNEALIVRSYSSKLQKRFNTVESKARPNDEGGKGSAFIPTMNLIRSYLMDDGLPAEVGNPKFDATLFWKNRDPRFAATIAYNGSSYKLSGNANRKQWTYTGVSGGNKEAFYSKKFTSPDLARTNVDQVNDIGGNGFNWIDLRFAEVIINYAECANEIGNMTLAKDMVRQLRVRAGIKAGTSDYGLALVGGGETAKMRDLIMNERMIEFAFEGKRYHDLRRTRRMHLLEGTIDIVAFDPVSAEMKAFLEKVNDDGVLNRDTVDVNNKDTYNKFFKTASTVPISGVGPFAVPETDYFYALPSTFLNSTPLLEQTIGWDIGTFDPLKN